MLAVFGSTISNPPQELSLPFKGSGSLRTSEEVAGFFESGRVDSTWYKFPNGDFMALSHKDEYATCPSYGLSKQANEAMVVVEAYKVLRDRAPYPADQVIKELDGKFSFVLFDAKATKLFIARDRDGSAQLHWGVAADGCLACSDDPEIVKYGCGNRYTPFPPGCLFKSEEGLISFDHPLNKVRGVMREDDEGYSTAVIFQVDLFTRLYSIPRTGSDANWSGVTVVESES
nr:stem-specific protein TSJT1 [Tanacetum cinerariifolium]